MFGLGSFVMQYVRLRALVIATWTSLSPMVAQSPDAPAIADAIAMSVAQDATPVYGSADLEAAAMARWAYEESRVSLHPRPFSWDSRAGIANGVWQEHGPAGRADVYTQAMAWLRLAHGGSWCPDSPLAPLSGGCHGLARRLADRRVAQTRLVVSEFEVSE